MLSPFRGLLFQYSFVCRISMDESHSIFLYVDVSHVIFQSRQIGTDTDTDTDADTDTHTDTHTGRQAHRRRHRHTHTHTGRQAHTHRQTGTHTHTHRQTGQSSWLNRMGGIRDRPTHVRGSWVTTWSATAPHVWDSSYRSSYDGGASCPSSPPPSLPSPLPGGALATGAESSVVALLMPGA